MQRRQIKAGEVVKDLRSGMTDVDLMENYGLSPKGLESLFREMLQARLIEPADLQGRWSSYSHKVELEDNRKAARSSVNVLVSVHEASNPALKGIVLDISERGHGTTFKVYLPPAQESSGQVFKPSVGQAQLGGTETVLVVEDEEMVRDLACQTLEALGYRPLVASHPEQAITVSDTHNGPIHLLLSDVVLPQMDGKTMYDALSRKRPELKVLFMSGYTDSFIVDRGILRPWVYFVRKPFSVEVLAAKVREVLDG